MTKELLQQALVEVECYLRHGKMEQPNGLAIALRAALAQPVQPEEPPSIDPMRKHVEDFARKCGWEPSEGEGAFECAQRSSYEQGLKDGYAKRIRPELIAQPVQPAERPFITALIEDRRKQYGLDTSCTSEFLHWLDTQARREGVGANEAWNAGYGCAMKTIARPAEPATAYKGSRNDTH